jgi:hypothetical protein
MSTALAIRLPAPAALSEAQRYLGAAARRDLAAFAVRQLEARVRLRRLTGFYRENGCRMSRVHLLTCCAVVLGRFCGISAAFARIGEALMPVGPDGRLRTQAWRDYARACRLGRPPEIRDELWIAAHLRDMEAVREAGLLAAFERELREHPEDPVWRLLHQHMEFTLDARLCDGPALSGAVAGETVIAQGLARGLGRLLRAGWRLIGRLAWETLRALAWPEEESPGAISTRRAALGLCGYTLIAWTAASVYRRGVRALHRGRTAGEDEAWPLLAQVMGDEVREVHPWVVDFYSNPARFPVTAWLELNTVGSRVISFLATRLLGQGLYETGRGPLPARFRVYRREDGSMHFVRELYCGAALRVFDSDFVVRERGGRRTLHEVFPECGVDIEMEVRRLPGGGLSIRNRQIRVHGLRLPRLPLEVDFRSQVRPGPGGRAALEVDGHLRFGRRELGCIHYRIGPPAGKRSPRPPGVAACTAISGPAVASL